MSTRPTWIVVAVAVVALAAGIWVNRPPETPPLDATAGTKALLQLALPDGTGRQQALAQWSGRVIVANYWATWCPPCIEEMPAFERLHRKYSGNGVQFVGISIDSADKVLSFAKDHQITYPLLIGSVDTLEMTRAFGNRMQGLPLTVVVDRSGTAQKVKLGRLSETDLEAVLQRLI